LEDFKLDYDNKAFTLSHCWNVIKDSNKWEDSFALWQELEEKKKNKKKKKKKKKGKGNGNASTDGVINLDDKGKCLGNPAGQGWHLLGVHARLHAKRLSRPTLPVRPIPWRSKKPSRSSCSRRKKSLPRVDPKGVARSSRIHEICVGGRG
jgi:hypothetical protein